MVNERETKPRDAALSRPLALTIRLERIAIALERLVELGEIHLDDRIRPRCPHGNPHSACHACDVAGDLAFDAARVDADR
jgi:hypothetical protein